MPNIKSPYGMRNGIKVLHSDGVCWKCGKNITIGSLNWSYNTQIAGKYSHQDCNKALDTGYGPELKPKVSDTPTKQEQEQYNAASALDKLMLDALDKLKQTAQPTAVKPLTPVTPAKPSWTRLPVPKYHKYYDFMRLALTNAPRKAIYLAGAPGSSKTFTIMQYAEDVKLPYYCQPLSETSTGTDILGYISPMNKELVRTMFRDWYEHGGILDLPELDNTDPNTLTMINNAIDNGVCGFPDGMIKRHANAYLIANGNTDMRGPTSQFPGRRKLDASNVERFIFISWDYDTAFELAFYGSTETHAQYVMLVQKIRIAASSANIEIVVSQRAMRDGIAMLEAGFTFDQALSLTLFKAHPQTEDIYVSIGRPFIPAEKLFKGAN